MSETLTNVDDLERIYCSMDSEISEALTHVGIIKSNGNLSSLGTGKSSLVVSRERMDGLICQSLTALRAIDLEQDVAYQADAIKRQKRFLNMIYSELRLTADETGDVSIIVWPSARKFIERMKTVNKQLKKLSRPIAKVGGAITLIIFGAMLSSLLSIEHSDEQAVDPYQPRATNHALSNAEHIDAIRKHGYTVQQGKDDGLVRESSPSSLDTQSAMSK